MSKRSKIKYPNTIISPHEALDLKKLKLRVGSSSIRRVYVPVLSTLDVAFVLVIN